MALKLAAYLGLCLAGVAGLYYLGANGYLTSGVDEEEKPLNYLALKLESTFRRDVKKDQYSIDYSAKPPNTIVIAVGYYNSTDRALLNSIVRAAGENARGVARDQFHIPNLIVEDSWTKLPGKPEPIETSEPPPENAAQ